MSDRAEYPPPEIEGHTKKVVSHVIYRRMQNMAEGLKKEEEVERGVFPFVVAVVGGAAVLCMVLLLIAQIPSMRPFAPQTSAPAPATFMKLATSRYANHCREQIETYLHQQLESATSSYHLKSPAVFAVTILTDGRIDKVGIVQSSGDNSFDALTASLLEKKARLDPFPEEMSRMEKFVLEFPVGLTSPASGSGHPAHATIQA